MLHCVLRRCQRQCNTHVTEVSSLSKTLNQRCYSASATSAVASTHTPNPHDTALPQPMSKYGNERIALGSLVALAMEAMPSQPKYFLDNGTLLGLWRNNALIDSDDDFDFGLLVHKKEFDSTYMQHFQHEFQIQLEQQLQATKSNIKYESRIVSTYADKIEIYDPNSGSFPLQGDKYKGARYHHVSVDVQIHLVEQEATEHKEHKEEAEAEAEPPLPVVQILKSKILTSTAGVTIRHSDFATRGQASLSAYEPFETVRFADRDWPVPAQQELFLSYLYGYVGTGAEFDAHSMLYRLPLASSNVQRTSIRLYTDMCADLFHTGHVNYLRQCSQVGENIELIVGLHSDATIESYKRPSVCTLKERVGVVEACKYVHTVVEDAPLRVTEEFMKKHDIDFVIHGTETPEAERQAMYDVPIGLGRYTEVPRTEGISTTELIDRIASRLAVDYEDHALPSERQTTNAIVREMSTKVVSDDGATKTML